MRSSDVLPGTRALTMWCDHPGTKAATFSVNHVNRASHLASATNGAMPPLKAIAASRSQHDPRPRSGAGGTNDRLGQWDIDSATSAELLNLAGPPPIGAGPYPH